jgi:hypothetical protein
MQIIKASRARALASTGDILAAIDRLTAQFEALRSALLTKLTDA